MGFSKDFIWGGASAAYQVEGAYNEDGKGMNIWDVYSRVPGHVKYTETGDVACDHYHRYKEDIALFKEIGLKYYRFSISWTRVMPDGIGKINEKGIQFYSNLIDELLKAGIEPMVTIHHWDYPYELYKKGGWMNDESPKWFEEYTKVLVDAFSDRVKYWITINEPQCIIGCGYWGGHHAPFQKYSNRELILMSHNLLLAHGRAVKCLREHAKINPIVSFAPTGPSFVPEDNKPETIEEARRKTMNMSHGLYFSNTWWSDPVYLGKYPDEAYEIFGEDMITPSKEDMELISQPLDYYATNIYYSEKSRPQYTYETNAYQGAPRTTMNWRVTEEVMYWSPKFLYERYGLPILISENGIASMDWVDRHGKVCDPNREDYIARYVSHLMKAADEGIPIMGYLYWSVMDNYEWSEGYDKRFGLIYVDYLTQKRTIKESGYWYKKLIESNGELAYE
ncbi:MAG: beta-glucosidase [Lachnospiraceae bacterium]|nr:beta-glucosidase [Lachnospiraceae bacterium]